MNWISVKDRLPEDGMEELLKKLNKLDCIYNLINSEIEAYDVSISGNVFEIWQKRKQRIQLNLINQFKEEVLTDFFEWINVYEELKYTKKGVKFYVDEFCKTKDK